MKKTTELENCTHPLCKQAFAPPLKVRFLCEHHLIVHPECSNATEVDPKECAYRSKSPCRPEPIDGNDPPGCGCPPGNARTIDTRQALKREKLEQNAKDVAAAVANRKIAGSTQGKCRICRVAYRWPANTMRLRNAFCPDCGQKLQATTYLLQWPWRTIPRPATVFEAIRIRNERSKKA